MQRIALGTVLVLGACAPILELSPSTAASRISSSDGYKQEACAIMQDYLDHMNAFEWDTVEPLAPKPAAEIEHLAAVFAAGPEVTCRVKSNKRIHDLRAREFGQVVSTVGAMQEIYGGLLPGTSLLDCIACDLPGYPAGNGVLLEYFKRDPFPAARDAHRELYVSACMAGEDPPHPDHSRGGALHFPLSAEHGDCHDVWRSELQAQISRCNRFGTTPYLICPNTVWSDESQPARPVSYLPQGYREVRTHAGGFYIRLADGVEVYWQTGPQTLDRMRIEGTLKPKFDDFDRDGRVDLNVGEFLFLARADRTVERVTLSDFRADAEARAAAAKSAGFRRRLADYPLDDLERLLYSTHAGDPEVIALAAERSWEWWRSAVETQRGVAESVQVYWHMALWNKVAGKRSVPGDYLSPVGVRLEMREIEHAKRNIEQARSDRSGELLLGRCETLRRQVARYVDDMRLAHAGTQAAARELSDAWERYLALPLPVFEADAKKKSAEALLVEVEAYLSTTCH